MNTPHGDDAEREQRERADQREIDELRAEMWAEDREKMEDQERMECQAK